MPEQVEWCNAYRYLFPEQIQRWNVYRYILPEPIAWWSAVRYLLPDPIEWRTVYRYLSVETICFVQQLSIDVYRINPKFLSLSANILSPEDEEYESSSWNICQYA